MVHHRNSLLGDLHPTILCVKKTQKSHLALHIHRNRDPHLVAASVQPIQDWFLEGRWEAALPNWMGLLGAILRARGSCD